MARTMEVVKEERNVTTLSPVRFKGNYSAIGLDLGSTQVKIVQFRKERQQVSLYQYGIYDLPEGAITRAESPIPGPFLNAWPDL